MNLSTGSSEMLVVVECLPSTRTHQHPFPSIESDDHSQVVDRALPRLGTSVEETDDVGLEMLANGVEEPAMTVDLLGILLLETVSGRVSEALRRAGTRRTRRSFELERGCWDCNVPR